MRFFDLHADTPFKMAHECLSSDSPRLHVRLEDIHAFDAYTPIFALWADSTLFDEQAFADVLSVYRQFCKTRLYRSLGKVLFAVEDARILSGKLERLDLLKSLGVSVLTLQWKGQSCIGGGWDTSLPLTSFGRGVVKRCAALGILPDVSHASREVLQETAAIAKKNGVPILSTHANAFSVCPHRRNLTDEDASTVIDSGGLIGLSFVPEHLSAFGNAGVEDILKHIEHFLFLGAAGALAIGSDFDGTDVLPKNIGRIGDVPALFDQVQKAFGKKTAERIFYRNAAEFFHIPM